MKPGAVVGFGGYPAFPPLVAATLRGIPTALHEQNAVLGRANRALASHVTVIATSFENTKYLSGARSRSAADRQSRARPGGRLGHARAIASRANGPFSLLVFGGSQGARFFADALPAGLATLPEAIRASLFVVQQCREEDLARVEQAYQAAGVRAHLATFFTNLPEEMAKAHLVIGRCGCLHGGRAYRDGPPRGTGPAAACDRQRPAAECESACRNRTVLGALSRRT